MKAFRNTLLSAVVTGSRVGATAVTMLILARSLGPHGFGELTYALTLSAVFAVLPDYGFSLQIVKRVAAAPGGARNVWRAATVAKLALGGLTLLAAVMWFQFGVATDISRSLVLILLGSALALSFGQLNSYVLRGIDRFDLDALTSLALNGLLLFGVLGVVAVHGGVVEAALVFLIARLVYLLITLRFVRAAETAPMSVGGLHVRPISVLREGFPYGVHTAVAVLYVSFDTLVLAHYQDSSSVGIYQAGMRLVFASMFAPEILTSGLFPSFASTLARSDFYTAVRLGRAMNRAMVVGGASIATLMVLHATTIRSLIFREPYGPLDMLLPWFGLVILFRFVSATYGAVATAAGGQTVRTLLGIAALVINIVANLTLVPRYGLRGAMAASVATHGALLVAYAVLSRSLVRDWLLDVRTLSCALLIAALAFIGLAGPTRSKLVVTLALPIVVFAIGSTQAERSQLRDFIPRLSPSRQQA